MSKIQYNKNVKCPFYLYEGMKPLTITCEGMTDNSVNHTEFKCKQDYIDHKHKFCYTMNYLKCPYADMLDYNKY